MYDSSKGIPVDCLSSFLAMENHAVVISHLFKEKERLEESNIVFKSKVEDLSHKYQNALTELNNLKVENEAFKKTKAISDRFYDGHKKFKILKKILKAKKDKSPYDGLEEDINFLK